MAAYTVKSGDSLSKIARDVLGDMSLWPEIARSNGIVAPYLIFPGQVLELPELGADVVTMPGEATPGASQPARPADIAANGAAGSPRRLLVFGALAAIGVGLYLATPRSPRRRARRR